MSLYNVEDYQQCLNQAVNSGLYQMNQPTINGCYPQDTNIRIQNQNWYQRGGVSTFNNIVDVNSEILNINRKLSRCPGTKYLSDCNNVNCNCKYGYPCGGGVINSCNDNGERCIDKDLYHPTDCNTGYLETQHTKLDKCNLREVGINRWEWLNKNPQDNVTIPFEYNINTRTLVKDNHRPCILTPLNN